MTQTDITGWFPDPSQRNEARYFANGQPTDLVMRNGRELVDPIVANYRSTTTTATAVEDEPASFVPSSTDDQTLPPSSGSRTGWIVAAGLALLVVAFATTLLVRGVGNDDDAATTGPTTTVLDVASILRTELCSSSSSSGCSVESSPGVIEVYMSKYSVTESGLLNAGNRTGLWTPADVARMLRTRALDGTQRTADNRVSWTYHPDNGLQLVIDTGR